MIQLIEYKDEWIEWLYSHINYREKLRLSKGTFIPKTMCRICHALLKTEVLPIGQGYTNDSEEIKIV